MRGEMDVDERKMIMALLSAWTRKVHQAAFPARNAGPGKGPCCDTGCAHGTAP